jgi:hypothetical protein
MLGAAPGRAVARGADNAAITVDYGLLESAGATADIRQKQQVTGNLAGILLSCLLSCLPSCQASGTTSLRMCHARCEKKSCRQFFARCEVQDAEQKPRKKLSPTLERQELKKARGSDARRWLMMRERPPIGWEAVPWILTDHGVNIRIVTRSDPMRTREVDGIVVQYLGGSRNVLRLLR